MNKIKDVVIIGCGAAGMMAAITAAQGGADVLVLEHMDTAGKKLLATGNGKCNYTNKKQGVSHYRGENPAFVLPVFSQFDVKKTLHFFEELGIYPKEKNGYYYPASEQASSVLKVLQMELMRLGVTILYGVGIRSIQKENGLFVLDTKSEVYRGKTCILCCGGCAAKKTGSDGSGFIYAKKLGHDVVQTVPALVQLVAGEGFYRELSGVRIQGTVSIYAKKKLLSSSTGEIQLTDYGISGIPTFQVSRFAAKALATGASVTAVLDFFPEQELSELEVLLKNRFATASNAKKSSAEALVGLFPEKMISVFLREAGISEKKEAKLIAEPELYELCKQIKQFHVPIVATNKFDMAQVTAGGISTEQLVNDSLESKLVPGLFFAGEMIDIDGECGGYNLQWAWSSGAVAGKAASARSKTVNEKIRG